VQFGVNRETGEIVVIEMNPRVSRSSALASKATGYPIAKVATKLAIGYTLDEIPNDLTQTTPASFEPTLDYVVLKMPRFAFEKFPGSDERLTTQMKSVGEAMSIGRTFCEAFGKALRSRELDTPPRLTGPVDVPFWDRYDTILARLRAGETPEALAAEADVHIWFLHELARMVAVEEELVAAGLGQITPALWRRAKRHGLGDSWLAKRLGAAEADVRAARIGAGVRPVYKAVDSCAAEVEARSSYRYSTYEDEHEPVEDDRPSVLILGSGPNRIGQGLEFDYCCVHAAMTFRALGYAAIMVNCNPETVSTDYDTSDRLYFEPLTLEDVLAIVAVEQPEGVIVQFGGQTPLRLAAGLEAAGVPLLGTQPEAIDLAEDRGRFGALLARLGLKAPPYALANSPAEALAAGPRVGFPLLVRPSYVLGGRSMELAYDEAMLSDYFERVRPRGEIFLDRFLENAIEVDVDAICDGEDVWIGGIMQHVEEAGIHSGDSACVLPPHSLGTEMLNEIRAASRGLALALGVVGLINIQYGVYGEDLYVIEANPRASRTVPFVSKATGLPLAKLACRVMLGEKLAALALPEDPCGSHVSVKEAVLPFDRFAGADALLGPEMRSTGEVMGVAADFPAAFAKAQAAVGSRLPQAGTVFLTVTDSDKPAVMGIAAQLHDLGFRIVATRGTAAAIKRMGIPVETLNKIQDGSPHVVEAIDGGDVDLVINTPTGTAARSDGYEIRRAAVARGVPCITTIAGGMAAARAISAARLGDPPVVSLQELHANGVQHV
jgi:carbamoyl-phosphate synthase large subunit